MKCLGGFFINHSKKCNNLSTIRVVSGVSWIITVTLVVDFVLYSTECIRNTVGSTFNDSSGIWSWQQKCESCKYQAVMGESSHQLTIILSVVTIIGELFNQARTQFHKR